MELKNLSEWMMGGTPKAPNNQRAIEEVYNKYKRLMFATARKYTEDIANQEDIVQTSLERLLKKFANIDPLKCCISAEYIVYTVRSVSIDFLRKQDREAGHCIYVEDEKLEEIAKTDGMLDDLRSISESAEILHTLWPRLPAEDRILLEGKYILGQTDKELASILKCESSSIRMKLTRARRRAMKLLSERN
jgi:RNA polymerase sigma-70 factor (ECF subfamily)